MSRLSLALILALALAPMTASADSLGNVTKVLRPQVRTFDAQGQPAGQIAATAVKVPAPIVGYGVGNSIGVNVAGKVVYFRGLDVETDKAHADCKPVQTTARAAGSSYAATNMGLGGAADCRAAGQ